MIVASTTTRANRGNAARNVDGASSPLGRSARADKDSKADCPPGVVGCNAAESIAARYGPTIGRLRCSEPTRSAPSIRRSGRHLIQLQLFVEPTRNRDRGVLVVYGQLAFNDQLAQVVLDRLDPRARAAVEQLHQLPTIQRAGKPGDVLLLAQFADSPLELGHASGYGLASVSSTSGHVSPRERQQILDQVVTDVEH